MGNIIIETFINSINFIYIMKQKEAFTKQYKLNNRNINRDLKLSNNIIIILFLKLLKKSNNIAYDFVIKHEKNER